MFTRTLVTLMLLSACSGSVPAADDMALKISTLKEVNDAHHRLIELAEQCKERGCDSDGALDEKQIRRHVDLVFDKLDSSQVLWRLAVISYVSASPQAAGMQRVDAVFDLAWRAAVRKLSAIKSPEAKDALLAIASTLRTDAGDSLTLKEAIEGASK